jgi:hypothetical protein
MLIFLVMLLMAMAPMSVDWHSVGGSEAMSSTVASTVASTMSTMRIEWLVTVTFMPVLS